MKCYVYILESISHHFYYIGSTTDLPRRILQHNSGLTKSTHNKGPHRLVFSQEFNQIGQARIVEHKLKKWKSRKLVERVISDGIIKFVGD